MKKIIFMCAVFLIVTFSVAIGAKFETTRFAWRNAAETTTGETVTICTTSFRIVELIIVNDGSNDLYFDFGDSSFVIGDVATTAATSRLLSGDSITFDRGLEDVQIVGLKAADNSTDVHIHATLYQFKD